MKELIYILFVIVLFTACSKARPKSEVIKTITEKIQHYKALSQQYEQKAQQLDQRRRQLLEEELPNMLSFTQQERIRKDSLAWVKYKTLEDEGASVVNSYNSLRVRLAAQLTAAETYLVDVKANESNTEKILADWIVLHQNHIDQTISQEPISEQDAKNWEKNFLQTLKLWSQRSS